MPETIDETIARLEKLAAKATQATVRSRFSRIETDDEGFEGNLIVEANYDACIPATERQANLDFLAALRNAFPALIARIREQDAEIERQARRIAALERENANLRRRDTRFLIGGS